MDKKRKEDILVIAHDAGGAEIIAGYVKKYADAKNFHAYVAGPALRVFQREGIPFHKISSDDKAVVGIVKKNKDAACAILGTGWMTTIERDALSEAKELGIKTVVYLDSWFDYRIRFGFPGVGWQKNLPDEIWTGDRHAKLLAERYFRKTVIRLKKNQYFQNIIQRFRELRHGAKKPSGILFLSDALPGVEAILEDFLALLSKIASPPSLCIRLHPADDRTRYNGIIARYKKFVHIKKSRQGDILRDLLAARVVVGTETVAMVVSVLVGKKTMNISPRRQKSNLPFLGIIRPTTVLEAVELI